MEKSSIVRMAMGAIEERLDVEVTRVMENVLDLNTKADAKRKIVLTLELTPDSERKHVSLSATAKSTLAPTEPVKTSLYITSDRNGEMQVVEMVPQIPGQMNLSGGAQPEPKILKLVGTN